MKRLLSHLFVLTVNYQLLLAGLGVGLMGATLVTDSLNSWLVAGLFLLALALCLGYQFTRRQWHWQSPGEAWLGNDNKTDIARQARRFRSRRWPLLLLVALTLVLNGNLLDGLSAGQTYRPLDVLVAAGLFGVQFYTLDTFLRQPGYLPVLLLAFTLFGLGLSFELGSRALLSTDLNTLTGYRAVQLYKLLALAWLLLGWYYQQRRAALPSAEGDDAAR